jgi:perosamine synthetase
VIPRKRIDIGAVDLACGIAGCFVPGDTSSLEQRIAGAWNDGHAMLACLSVRSGFDALLGTLALPHGSEILLSAATLFDMARVIEAHGLVAVPVDLDMQTLAVSQTSLQRAMTPRTRALLVAHLFGSRMPVRELVEFSHKNNILLIEDCAQAYTGDAWRGEPASDVRLFSFGPIKTATALGGAVLSFRDKALRDNVRDYMTQWPLQRRTFYLSRLLQYALFAFFNNRTVYGVFAMACRWLGTTHEQVVSGAVRGFGGVEFLRGIRKRPSVPLLRMMLRRITQGEQPCVARRVARSRELLTLAPQLRHAGTRAASHTHWVFPVEETHAQALIDHLATCGFDAACGTSSLGVINAPEGHSVAVEARRVFASILYLPAHEGMNARDIERLAAALATFESPRETGQLEVS